MNGRRRARGLVLAALAAACAAPAIDQSSPVAWRDRAVAGREVDVECHVREDSFVGSGGTVADFTEQVRDLVVAFHGIAGRGLRFAWISRGDVDAATCVVACFDVDARGALHPLDEFGAGPRRPSRTLCDASILRLPWSRVLDGTPPAFERITGSAVRFETPCVGAARAGSFDLAADPPPPFDVTGSAPLHRVNRCSLRATVNAAGVLVGEEFAVAATWPTGDGPPESGERNDFAWRETGVRQWEGADLNELREENESIRRAYRVLNGDPTQALAELDRYFARAAPRLLDDVAQALADHAKVERERLDASLLAAVRGTASDDASNRAADLANALTGSSLSETQARGFHEIGRRIAWIESDPARIQALCDESLAAVELRHALPPAVHELAARLLSAGGRYESISRRSHRSESPEPVPVPPDAAEVRARVDELVRVLASELAAGGGREESHETKRVAAARLPDSVWLPYPMPKVHRGGWPDQS